MLDRQGDKIFYLSVVFSKIIAYNKSVIKIT